MSTQTLRTSTAPAIRVRARRDLQVFPRDSGLERQWVVKDPVSFSHFLFSDQEKYLLELFDGNRTLAEVRTLWQQHFRTHSLTENQLELLSHRFIRDKLVIVEQFGAGVRLHKDQQRTKSAQLATKLSSPLVVKLGGIDPRIVLDWLWLPGEILFNRFVVIFNLIVAVLVFGAMLGNFELIAERAGTLAEFFSVKNLLLMSVIVLVVKIFHELGHAVACRKYGGECFEIGVLLLAFFPTLYCDVTDSWTFANRWKRIMVSFAGIYVEILLATAGAILWLLTSPGLANTVFFNLAVMCSVSTLFINGNPLLKYDGYYIFSDFFEQPNLSENAKQSFHRWLAQFFFDVDPSQSGANTSSTSLSSGRWLTLFGLCSMLYRVFVIVSITIGVSVLLKHLEFGAFGDAIVLMLLATIGFRMLKQRPKLRQDVWRRFSLWRSLASLALLGFLVFACFVIPLPSHRYCQFSVAADRSAVVYAAHDGRVSLSVSPYTIVEAGNVVGLIDQPELQQRQQQTEAKLKNLQERAKRLVLRFEQSPTVASDLQLLKNEMQILETQLKSLETERQGLTLTAPLTGMVRPFPLPPQQSPAQLGLPTMPGSLFEPANKDALVRRGQPIMAVEGPQRKLVSYLGEKDVEFLAVGQTATLRFDAVPGQLYSGTISEIIEIDAQLDSSETEFSGLETFVDQTGDTKTLQTPYRVIIAVDALPTAIPIGSGGRARVSIPMKTVSQKVWFLLDRWWLERNY